MRLSSFVLAVLLSVGALVALAPDARATGGGIFGMSGVNGNSCSLCHNNATPTSAANFVMAPLNSDLPPTSLGYVPGATYAVTVSVTGGPGVRWGFNWYASDGTGLVTDATNTQERGLSDPEFAHTSAGSNQSSWSFDWIAPATGAVDVWLAGNSANGDMQNGPADHGTMGMQTILSPVAPELLVRLGNVNGGSDDLVPALFLNGTRGDDERFIPVNPGGPLTLSLQTYPGAPTGPMNPIAHAIYVLRRLNTANDIRTLPGGVGDMAMAIPATGGGQPVVVATNTLGHEPLLGTPRFTNAPNGPGTIIDVNVPVTLAGRQVVFQAIVPDSTASSGASVSNALVMDVSN